MLFDPPIRFRGLPASGFEAFGIRDRDERRGAIVDAFHAPLQALADDLVPELNARAREPLHAHLPRLDWPRGYQPFCTWLALSRLAHGYQAGAQLNLGVHADHVAIRLAWDTAADRYGRFEFLCLHGGLGPLLAEVAREHDLRFRLYVSTPWPEGARLAFESGDDWRAALAEARRHGNWLELGVRHDLPEALPLVTEPALEAETRRVFEALLPLYDRIG
jgi:hypothetical protein